MTGSPSIPFNATGDGNSILDHAFFLDVPKVTLDAETSDLARISLRLAGSLSIGAEGVDPAPRQVRLGLQVDALLEGVIEQVPQAAPTTLIGALFAPDPTFDIRASFTPVSVVASKLRVVGGSPLPQDWIDFLLRGR